jgi:hypothetical protein
MVNVIPYVLIAGVFIGNKMVTSLEDGEGSGNNLESSTKVPEQSGKTVESSKKVPDWRKMKQTLSRKDLERLANLTPDMMKVYATETKFTYKTISNWRMNARVELGLDTESND